MTFGNWILNINMIKLFTAFLLLSAIPGLCQKNGVTWYDPLTIADKTYGNIHPRIILDQAYNPLVLWSDATGRAFIAKWQGKAFGGPVQINPPGKYVFSEPWAGPELTNHGDTIYIVYKQIPEETSHIYLKHSYDGGKTFSVETQADDTGSYISRFPSVAIDLYGNPLVAYMKLDSGFTNPRYVVARSTDLGESFTGESPLNDYSGGKVSDCCPAQVLESGNATVILYRDNHDFVRNIWAGISTGAHLSFTKGLQVDQTNWTAKECPAHPPKGIIVADTLYSVYMSAPTDSSLIYLGKASLSGLSASSGPLTGYFTGLTSQNYPCIANSGDATAVAWQQTSGSLNEICMLFSNEITNGFPDMYDRVSQGLVSNADVALGNGHVYVVWQDDSSGNIMCRIGRYQETLTNKLLAENTTIYLQPSKSGKYFVVSIPDITACLMVDTTGKEYEMDMKCKKGSCRIYTEELDPGLYVVRVYGKDEKIFTYKYIVKAEE